MRPIIRYPFMSHLRFHDLPVVYRYLCATLLVMGGLFLLAAFADYVDNARFIFLFPIVFLIAWYLGKGPGLYALSLSVFSILLIFIPHSSQGLFISSEELVRLSGFVLNILLIIWMLGRGTRDERTIIENQKSLQEALFYRDEFLSIASHELKTPLTSLKLQSQMFKRGVLKNDPAIYLPEKIDRIVDQTDRQVSRLTRLVDDMLDISRIRTGKLSITTEPVNACELLTDLVEKMKPHILERLDSAPEISYCEKVLISCDKIRIEQVINNLVSNALKYGQNKPISIKMEKDAREVRFLVSDQGMGIAPENHDKIFNRFQRAIPASEVSGLGLGLYIARLIVDSHQGSLKVRSDLGQGSTFIVALPVL